MGPWSIHNMPALPPDAANAADIADATEAAHNY